MSFFFSTVFSQANHLFTASYHCKSDADILINWQESNKDFTTFSFIRVIYSLFFSQN